MIDKKMVLINLPTYKENVCSQSNYVNIISEILREKYEIVYTASSDVCDPLVREKSVVYLSNSSNLVAKFINYLLFYFRSFIFLTKNPNVIIISFTESVLPFYLGRQYVFLHDLLQLDYPRSWIVWCFYRFWVVPLCRNAGKVITTSETARTRLLMSKVQCDVVFRMYSVEDRPDVLCMSESVIFDAVYVGTLARHKDFSCFIEAVRSLKEHRFIAILPERDRRLVEAFKPDNLTLVSGLERADYWRLLSRCAVFVSTSLDEGFGPLYDAALVEIQSLVSDIPVYRELYSECSRFFPSGDADALQRVLLEILSLPQNSADYSQIRAKVEAAPLVFSQSFDGFYSSICCKEISG